MSSVPPEVALVVGEANPALDASVAEGTDGAAVPSALAPGMDDTDVTSPATGATALRDESEQPTVVIMATLTSPPARNIDIFLIARS